MNNSEIIKALTTSSDPNNLNCQPTTKLCKEALDLIKRQQETIDELTEDNRVYKAANMLISRQRDERDEEIECLESQLQSAKAEAVRKFAESLKRKSELVAPSVWAIPYRAVAVADIDKLLEEMGCNDGK